MKSAKLIIGMGFLLLSAISLACSLPAGIMSAQTTTPTPDITLTSIVAQLFVQATMTAQAALEEPLSTPTVVTDTPEPTATVVTPTEISPTATNTSTSTPEPTVSYVGPGKRSGPDVEAVFMYDAPTIDGVLDEWDMDRYDADTVVYGNSKWNGDNDLSSNFMLGWDEEYLYVAAKVKDEKYVQNASGKNLFKGDSLEILFDTSVSNDYYLDQLSRDDYQLGISPGSPKPGKNPEAYLWYPESFSGEKNSVKIGATEIDGGYRIEAKIPWDEFRIEPEKGDHYGFAFSVSDNDKSSENVQQSIVSNDPKRDLFDPMTWGDLTLVGSPIPGKRPGPSLEAGYLSSAPTIDGDLSEWTLGSVSVDHVTYGEEKWSGSHDLSGDVMVGWDESYLYLGVTVVDDSYQQRASGRNLYLGDSLEVLFDQNVQGDYLSHRLDSDDYQLGISPGSPDINTDPNAYLWYPLSKEGSKSRVNIAASVSADGYIIEVAIPWNAFNVTPKKGQHYGFIFSISDNDNTSKNTQQTIVSTVNQRVFTDPSTWGDLLLVK